MGYGCYQDFWTSLVTPLMFHLLSLPESRVETVTQLLDLQLGLVQTLSGFGFLAEPAAPSNPEESCSVQRAVATNQRRRRYTFI